MEREIIGYKLKEDCKQYRPAAVQISDAMVYPEKRGYYCVKDNASSIQNFEKAGVLKLWFEPVYKAEYQVGDWVIGWHSNSFNYRTTAWQIDKIRDNYVYRKNGHNTYTESIRKATPEEIKAAQYSQIEINGYEGEFYSDYVKFGCAYIKKEDILRLNKVMNDYFPGERDTNIIFKTIESVTIGKGTFTKDQIKEIAEYYLNK